VAVCGVQNFRQLHVWERAHAFALDVRKVARRFPRGFSDLRVQLTSAAESIATNLVEGCGAATPKEFARFIDISIKSTSEVDYQLQLAKDNGLIAAEKWQSLWDEVVQIRRMLYGLRRAILRRDNPGRRRPVPPNEDESD